MLISSIEQPVASLPNTQWWVPSPAMLHQPGLVAKFPHPQPPITAGGIEKSQPQREWLYSRPGNQNIVLLMELEIRGGMVGKSSGHPLVRWLWSALHMRISPVVCVG